MTTIFLGLCHPIPGLLDVVDWSALNCTLCGPYSEATVIQMQLQKMQPEILILDLQIPSSETILNQIQALPVAPAFILLPADDIVHYPPDATILNAKCAPATAMSILHALTVCQAQAPVDSTIYYPTAEQIRVESVRCAVLCAINGVQLPLLTSWLSQYSFYHLAIIQCKQSQNQVLKHAYLKVLLKQWFQNQQPDTVPILTDFKTGTFLALFYSNIPFSLLLAELQATMNQEDHALHNTVVVGFSKEFHRLSYLPQAFKQASQALGRHFFESSRTVFQYDDQLPESVDTDILIKYPFDELISCIRHGNAEQFLEMVECFSKQMAILNWKEPDGILRCRSHFLALTNLLTSELASIAPNTRHATVIHYPGEAILRADNLQALQFAVKEYGLRILNLQAKPQIEQQNRIVETILSFLSEHYSENLTLAHIAAQVHMNSSYVSRLLKQRTGKTFTQLLLEIRIEHAKVLLLTTYYRVYQIAESVGIENAKYFSQVFRQYTGQTPTAFRNTCGNVSIPE